MQFRVQFCKAYARAFGANVLAIDYRGFGDSEGTPSEEGLIRDARAAWDWVIDGGARAEDVALVGLSLGTGVVAGLAAQLSKEGTCQFNFIFHNVYTKLRHLYPFILGIIPRGVMLHAPFTTIAELLQTYHLFGIIPILRPLRSLPVLSSKPRPRIRLSSSLNMTQISC